MVSPIGRPPCRRCRFPLAEAGRTPALPPPPPESPTLPLASPPPIGA